jgi:hypothetical protein
MAKPKTMDLRTILAEMVNTKPYESVRSILGPDLGRLIHMLVAAAGRADRELDIVHECLRELYDANPGRVKRALDEVEALNEGGE